MYDYREKLIEARAYKQKVQFYRLFPDDMSFV